MRRLIMNIHTRDAVRCVTNMNSIDCNLLIERTTTSEHSECTEHVIVSTSDNVLRVLAYHIEDELFVQAGLIYLSTLFIILTVYIYNCHILNCIGLFRVVHMRSNFLGPTRHTSDPSSRSQEESLPNSASPAQHDLERRNFKIKYYMLMQSTLTVTIVFWPERKSFLYNGNLSLNDSIASVTVTYYNIFTTKT
jgi:cbb3-type cytochrome oxidase subunit 3